jgi:hypothetical protein
MHILREIVIGVVWGAITLLAAISSFDVIGDLINGIRKRIGPRKVIRSMFNSIIRNLASFWPKLARFMKDPTYDDFKNLTLYHGYEVILPLLNLSEVNQVDVIRRHYDDEIIAHMKNPCDAAKRLTIKQRPFSIKAIKEPSAKLQKYAVKLNPEAIYFIRNPTVSAMKLAVTKDPNIVNRLKNPPDSVKKAAIYAMLSKES